MTGRHHDYVVVDDFVQKAGREAPPGEETDMQTYRYEVLVTEKREHRNPCMKVLREKQIIDRKDGLLEEPSREALLLKYAVELNTFEAEQAIEHPESEVVINIRPFCG